MPLLVAEPATPALQQLYASDSGVIVWWATETECVSAVTRIEREGRLTSPSAEEALERLDALKGAWNEVQPLESVRRTARRLLRVHPLRAADALQLAAALIASEGRPDSLEVVSLDERLVGAARREGLVVREP